MLSAAVSVLFLSLRYEQRDNYVAKLAAVVVNQIQKILIK